MLYSFDAEKSTVKLFGIVLNRSKYIVFGYFILTMCSHICLCVGLCMYVFCPWKPEENVGYPGVSLTGSSESRNLGSRNLTQSLRQRSIRY